MEQSEHLNAAVGKLERASNEKTKTNKIGGNNNKRMNGKDCLDSKAY